MSLTETTYAQVVERALLAERAEQLIYRENAARRESRKAAQAASAPQRSEVPVIRNGRLQIQAVQRETASRGADLIKDKVGPVTGETILTVRSAGVDTWGSASRELVTIVAVMSI